jgi:hypothetical protein
MPDSLRPACLFNYNMLSFQDANWARRAIRAPGCILARARCLRRRSTPAALGIAFEGGATPAAAGDGPHRRPPGRRRR